jgi:hypothetical protein
MCPTTPTWTGPLQKIKSPAWCLHGLSAAPLRKRNHIQIWTWPACTRLTLLSCQFQNLQFRFFKFRLELGLSSRCLQSLLRFVIARLNFMVNQLGILWNLNFHASACSGTATHDSFLEVVGAAAYSSRMLTEPQKSTSKKMRRCVKLCKYYVWWVSKATKVVLAFNSALRTMVDYAYITIFGPLAHFPQ